MDRMHITVYIIILVSNEYLWTTNPLFKRKIELGVVEHAWNPSYSGGEGRRIMVHGQKLLWGLILKTAKKTKVWLKW
jgi:hypothetical protein